MTRRTYLSAGTAALLQAQEAASNRIGVIGNGNRSRAHFAALTKMPEAKIVALSDLESPKMAAVNATLASPAATYTDYRELIRDRNVSIVVIVAPNYLHHEMALAALRAGKDVVLEKPLGINYQQAVEILREAKRSGRTLAVCMQRRYMKQDIEVAEAVESGAIGNIKLIQISEMRGDWNPQSWRYTDSASGQSKNWRMVAKASGSTELEFSVHSLAHVYSLVKSPLARVSASGGVVYYKDRDTRDLSSILCDFQNGARLNYSFSCFAPPGGGGANFVILGDKGILRRDRGQLLLYKGQAQPQVLPAGTTNDDRAETLFYRDFFRDAAARRPSPLGPEFAIEPSKIAYAADISIRESRVVTARDFPPL